MPRNTVVNVAAVAVVAVFGIGIVASGDSVNPTWLRFFGPAAAAGAFAVLVWDRFAWRTPTVQKLNLANVDLRGTWKGTLTTLWKDPDTGVSPPPKDAYLVIRQTAVSVSVVLLTDESSSRSSLAEVIRTETGDEVSYVFVNSPASRHEDRSRMHRGSTHFEVVGRPAERLNGRYWTDRETRGELVFFERHRRAAGDYTAAKSLF